LKIFHAHPDYNVVNPVPGSLMTDGRDYLAIATADGALYLDEIQLPGKRRMQVREMLRGFRLDAGWIVK
jgi:methionyl-tRNA formyltransferase